MARPMDGTGRVDVDEVGYGSIQFAEMISEL